ncbi:MAG: pyridoxal-phosphate dependent enzyme [Thaumarchaeota archaeon]|nr:pyridoxal-phosphate dependent enzyme [Nitrososphaerota archaeon]
MQDPGETSGGAIDAELLRAFERDILSRIPHLEGGRIVNPTPLLDLTKAMKECASEEYGLELSGRDFSVFGKLEALLLGGSVKSRAATQIVHEAIRTGRLRRGMTVFEATSGNFGIALGLAGNLGLKVVVLVSRKLQEGVLEELDRSNVKTVDLDVDVCPAPGMQMDPNMLLAKVVATNMRERFSEIGLDTAVFDSARPRAEELLARQDVINLAKLFAEAYGGFCPEQYDNEQNVNAHASVTGPEIDQQVHELGYSLEDFRVVCTFGTGGTSGGLSRYVQGTYNGKKVVHVVFPPEGRDVAGIRTKGKAAGLKFYEPERYAGEHEVDFEQAKRLFTFLVGRGFDIGESSALALYAVLQMVNFGMEGKFVVILADGAKKYKRVFESALDQEDQEEGLEVTLESANARPGRFDEVVWTHTGYVPSEEGLKLIASSLGRPASSVRVAAPRDVVMLVTGRDLPPGLTAVLDGSSSPGGGAKRILLVCMSGNTSLRAAQALKSKGIKSQSLTGGITKLAQVSHKPLPSLVRPAT